MHPRLLVLLPLPLFAQSAPASVPEPRSPPAASAPDDARIERLDGKAAVPADAVLRIENPHGDIRLRDGGPGRDAEFHAVFQQLDPAGGRVTARFANEPGALVLRVARPAAASAGRCDLAVYVPRGVKVIAIVDAGAIETRGVKGDAQLRSGAGDISVRGVAGLLDIESGAGSIAVVLEKPPAGAQRFASTTGSILLQFPAGSEAAVSAETSGEITSDFSFEMTRMPRREPSKRAVVRLGASTAATLSVHSLRGALRLIALAGWE